VSVGPFTTAVPARWHVRVVHTHGSTLDFISTSGARVSDLGLPTDDSVGLTAGETSVTALRAAGHGAVPTDPLALLPRLAGVPTGATDVRALVAPRRVSVAGSAAADAVLTYRTHGRVFTQENVVTRRGSAVVFFEADASPRQRTDAARDLSVLTTHWQWQPPTA